MVVNINSPVFEDFAVLGGRVFDKAGYTAAIFSVDGYIAVEDAILEGTVLYKSSKTAGVAFVILAEDLEFAYILSDLSGNGTTFHHGSVFHVANYGTGEDILGIEVDIIKDEILDRTAIGISNES